MIYKNLIHYKLNTARMTHLYVRCLPVDTLREYVRGPVREEFASCRVLHWNDGERCQVIRYAHGGHRFHLGEEISFHHLATVWSELNKQASRQRQR